MSKNTKNVLGRGLGVYFPGSGNDTSIQKDATENQSSLGSIDHIPVANIRANPNQPRKEFDEFRLQELSESIRQHGLIQPITVREIGEGRYELISGERRLRATRMAGLDKIPAYVRQANDDQSLEYALIENIQREQLNPIETALGFQRLMEELDYTQEKVAERVGKNRSTVTNTLRLLQLPDVVQLAVKQGKISAGHARALVTIDNPQIQEKVLQKAIDEDFSVRQMEVYVKSLQSARTKKNVLLKPKEQHSIELQELASRLRTRFGTKVQLKKKQMGGEIRIEYYNNDELERILSLFDQITS
jgi:ParB family transcriptional regulator, chromosome partitioning protein